jgi:hypothetical protein
MHTQRHRKRGRQSGNEKYCLVLAFYHKPMEMNIVT